MQIAACVVCLAGLAAYALAMARAGDQRDTAMEERLLAIESTRFRHADALRIRAEMAYRVARVELALRLTPPATEDVEKAVREALAHNE